MVAVKISISRTCSRKIDWRAIPEEQLRIEPYILPLSLEKKILYFMQQLGLVFGSLDFIVTLDDEYIFLEINEQGNFYGLKSIIQI